MTYEGARRAHTNQPLDLGPLAALAGVRVAMFTGNYNYVKEGANQALNKLVAHLEKRVGATVRIYSPVSATPAFEPQGTLVAVPSIALPVRSEFRLALGLRRPARADIRAFAPDIVHVATPDILSYQAQTFARQLGVPVIASLHTHFETYFDYYGLGFLRSLVERHLDRFYGRSDVVLVPSRAVIDDMARRHDPKKLRLWARGVDTDQFDPAHRSLAWRQSHDIGDEAIALAFFGRLVLEKGVDRFAETVQTLRQRGLPVRPVFIGEGPARERMQAALPDAVFTGHLAGDELSTAVASCDVLMNPSLTETFGNVTLEAMASGLAVVAADAPSTANLIADGANGLISPSDTPGFADRIGRLVEDRALRLDIGQAARQTALSWKWDEILDAALASYATLLTPQGERRNVL